MAKQSQEKSTDLAPLESKGRGLQLATVEQMHRFCQFAKASEYLPKHVKTIEQAVMIVEMGAEVGLPPWSALKHIAVIAGVPSIWGDAALGLCQSSPHWEEEGHREWFSGGSLEDAVAHCQVQRKGGEPFEAVFSWKDAERGKLTSRETYKQFPKDMLMWRARSRALKAKFSDVLMGLSVEAPAEWVDSVATAPPRGEWPPASVERRDATEAVNRALDSLPATEEETQPEPQTTEA